jgi:hypothetical protein
LKRQCLFLIAFVISPVVFAQKRVTHQSLYWLRYYNQLVVNKDWTWHNEIENRRFFNGNTQHHLIMHTHLHRQVFKNTDLALGLTYSRQSPHDPNSIIRLVVPEIRPFQEISYSNPISNRLALNQRFRLDERFIRANNGKESLDEYNFNLRFRYRLQANYKLNEKASVHFTTLKISNELMINQGKRIVNNQLDQNRISLGIEKGFYKGLSMELGYLHWYQQRPSGNQFFERNIIRLTVNHKTHL